MFIRPDYIGTVDELKKELEKALKSFTEDKNKLPVDGGYKL